MSDARPVPPASLSADAAALALETERAAHTRAEASLFERDRVLSILSHDLRGPLNAIHSWAHVLERKLASEDPGVIRALEGIRTGVSQQVLLLEQVVDTARADTRHLPLHKQAVNLPELLDSVVTNLAATPRTGATVTFNAALAGQGDLQADYERLWQALWVVLRFASQAADPGADQPVELRAKVDAGQWLLGVRYRRAAAPAGVAADSDTLNTVFTHTVDVRTAAGQTVDIGLALPVRVIEAHGGALAVVAPSDDGDVELTIKLPALAVAQGKP
ncbi:MAG: sensor histidine kinase [Janthinobacterium lividum]